MNNIFKRQQFNAMEVYLSSQRKASYMVVKKWRKIQSILSCIGFKSDFKMRVLVLHELGGVTATITGKPHAKGRTE